jgi:hypothetical protein
MGRRERAVLPAYDFAEALLLSPVERMTRSVEDIRKKLVAKGAWELQDIPPIPTRGATPDELVALETRLGVSLPGEYRQCLARWRYLDMGTGLQIWGFDHEGIMIGSPWVSTKHRAGSAFLVFGEYWNYADGDQLYFDLADSHETVYAYFHEQGPAYESFAPSFSLALWRLVHERR